MTTALDAQARETCRLVGDGVGANNLPGDVGRDSPSHVSTIHRKHNVHSRQEIAELFEEHRRTPGTPRGNRPQRYRQ